LQESSLQAFQLKLLCRILAICHALTLDMFVFFSILVRSGFDEGVLLVFVLSRCFCLCLWFVHVRSFIKEVCTLTRCALVSSIWRPWHHLQNVEYLWHTIITALQILLWGYRINRPFVLVLSLASLFLVSDSGMAEKL
jgi:hypothetical protein